jgi:hypothetical protein
MRFYDVPVNRSVPTEANRGLTSYNWEEWIFLQKDSTDRHHLWSMVNPDLNEAAL